MTWRARQRARLQAWSCGVRWWVVLGFGGALALDAVVLLAFYLLLR